MIHEEGPGAPDEVLVDPHLMSAGHSVWVTLVDVTPYGPLVAYGIRSGGEGQVTVPLLDVDSPEHPAEVLPLPAGR